MDYTFLTNKMFTLSNYIHTQHEKMKKRGKKNKEIILYKKIFNECWSTSVFINIMLITVYLNTLKKIT